LKNINPEFQNFAESKSIGIRKTVSTFSEKQRNPNRNEKQNEELAKT